MAKISNNLIMQNITGMIGKQIVFKNRKGKVYACAAPTFDKNRKPTKGQLAARENFKRKSEYAKYAIRDIDVKTAYLAVAKPGQNAYNIAVRDAGIPPTITSIITRGYKGTVGNIIIVQAMDDFKVASVKVSIRNAENKIIEEGKAIADGINWIYEVTKNILGTKIIATASDLPGNTGSLEVMLK
jgi:hypothetical protein